MTTKRIPVPNVYHRNFIIDSDLDTSDTVTTQWPEGLLFGMNIYEITVITRNSAFYK